MKMVMIIGLGNPGKKYEFTRHNVGFLVVDEIAKRLNILRYQSKFNAHFATAEYLGVKIILCKPQTYMNLSGEAVFAIGNYFKIETKDMIVISDDMDLPPGKVRIRPFGGAGGQKGLKNIIDRLQTNRFPRIRIGIGKDPMIEAADYVLGKFEKENHDLYIATIKQAVEAALVFAVDGLEKAMNQYNKNHHEEDTANNQ
jgi:PTH1 family peptidyl-tRNA hydrolase